MARKKKETSELSAKEIREQLVQIEADKKALEARYKADRARYIELTGKK